MSTFVAEKVSLEAPPTQKSENQRVQHLQWSLMLDDHLMVPRSSILSLRKSKQNSAHSMTVQEQNDTPIAKSSGATHPGRRSRRTSRPNTNCVRNLLQRRRSETSNQRRCIADTAASLMSVTAGVGCCISDHFVKSRSCTVGQMNCIAKRTTMLSLRKRCSLSTILVWKGENQLSVNKSTHFAMEEGGRLGGGGGGKHKSDSPPTGNHMFLLDTKS